MAHVATARTKARKRALDLLFAAEARGLSAGDLLDQQIREGEVPNNPFTVKLVRGVVAESERIDALISAFAKDWTLTRMPAVDRNVLRIGVWELLDGDVAPEVAISEATALVTELSTDDSPSFVNGVLAAVAKDLAKR
ncbi:transcription antitermination factor NusB [Nocardioides luteus]|uniref:Transcription antitermination protein NusB n=1 Tax=Nocardioides luteus TaxID=1844 RepID=A0A1J4NE08_9ACTN|nr:transcription antitermination factor NusB [Nocardioides luteus]OIJ28697.1 transcription antitermination factor NusB [Nocardioides luteus]